MDMNEDEQMVIMVGAARNITLVFENCTVDVFQHEGVVFTRTETIYDARKEFPRNSNEVFDISETFIETQDILDHPDPDVVKLYAGGDFASVNEKHAFVLEECDIMGVDDNNDDSGDTQLEFTQTDF